MRHVLYCPNCGKAMSVAAEHTVMHIACPFCRYRFRPAARTRIVQAAVDRGLVPDPGSAYPAVSPQWGDLTKSRVVAGLLGIFLGAFGAHRFYLGYTGIGLLQLCLTLGGLFLFPPLVVCTVPMVAVWGFIEGLSCLAGWMTDAEGRPLTL